MLKNLNGKSRFFSFSNETIVGITTEYADIIEKMWKMPKLL